MSYYNHNPDRLKPLDLIGEPDPRSKHFVRFEPVNMEDKTIALSDHHADIARFSLAPSVPEAIHIHFETGKNLYLYAWFVYRFYPVADLHVRATLELALKTRIGEKNLVDACKSVGKNKGLNGYILFAIKQGWIQNEGFQRWWQTAQIRPENRTTIELIEEMEKTGVTEVEFDKSSIEITELDKDRDFLAVLADVFPKIRNEYAHGSSLLDKQVLGTFELVAEFINQLWSEPDIA